MVDYHEKIKEIEEQLAKARYNKATEKWFGLMKVRLAQLREKIEKRASAGKSKGGFFVKKSGDATVVLVGFPSVGKSTLLNAITGSKSKTGAYAFTTLDAVPGTLNYRGAKIQIIDVPGIISGAAFGKGRGKEVLAMARTADLILFVVDVNHPEHFPALQKEVYDVSIRVNKRRPDVKIARKPKDGISLSSTAKLRVEKATLREILRSYKIMNADVVVRDPIDMDDFIDAIEGNRSYIPAITAVSKVDSVSIAHAKEVAGLLNTDVLVSATTGQGIEYLKDRIFDELRFARIYMKEINKKADMDEPMVLQRPVTLKTVCERIHRDFVKKFRYARVWGPSAKFPGQTFRTVHKELMDGDVVEIHVS